MGQYRVSSQGTNDIVGGTGEKESSERIALASVVGIAESQRNGTPIDT